MEKEEVPSLQDVCVCMQKSVYFTGLVHNNSKWVERCMDRWVERRRS